jgi:hypothetical protein
VFQVSGNQWHSADPANAPNKQVSDLNGVSSFSQFRQQQDNKLALVYEFKLVPLQRQLSLLLLSEW